MSDKKTILVVDDTEANIDVLVETLGDDYEISVAMDGETALEAVYENHPDLVLLDIMMPGIDGYEVCRRIKADETTKHIPIIFITALSQVEDETKGLKLGAVDYVTKPISPPIVKARVENHLELKQAREDLEKQNHILQENIHLREEMDRISRHDLKTPLNSIISIPRILLQDSSRLAPDQVELLEIIEKSGHTMLSMINLSLDLFKMEKGTYKLEPTPVDIVSVIKKIIFDLRSSADAELIKFSIILNGQAASDDDTFGILGEELLCYSMFANIIKNAVEASPEGEIIKIYLSKNLDQLEQLNQAEIRINNQGVVPASIREIFFDKYATSGKKGGTGLGTYSAKLMAQTLGGEISMSTSEIEGTTIKVTLKYEQMERASISEPTISEPAVSILSQITPLKIMVVDDDEYNRLILERYLTNPNITVEAAENGQSALNKFKDAFFDMIFMDMEMPIMDGIEAVSLMRQWESHKTQLNKSKDKDYDKKRKSVIVGLSGHDASNIENICLDMGFDYYLSKPVSNAELYKTILKFFGSNEDLDDIGKNKIDENENINSNIVDIDADLEDLIPSFMRDKKNDIEKISAIINGQLSLDSDSYNLIQKLGHKIKGGFNMYGFKKQGAVGTLIEDAAKENSLAKIKDNIKLLNSSLQNIEIRYVSMD